MIESFARHLMRAIDSWQVDGFDRVARDYLGRVPRERQTILRIDDQRRSPHAPHRHRQDRAERAGQALATPSWLDPKLGGPRL